MARTTIQDAIDRMTEEAQGIWLKRNAKGYTVGTIFSIILLPVFLLTGQAFGFIRVGEGLWGDNADERERLKFLIRLKRLQAVKDDLDGLTVGYVPNVSGEYDSQNLETAIRLQEKKLAALLEDHFGDKGQPYGGASPSFFRIKTATLRQWAAHPEGAAPREEQN